jgi:hypothetical protein
MKFSISSRCDFTILVALRLAPITGTVLRREPAMASGRSPAFNKPSPGGFAATLSQRERVFS